MVKRKGFTLIELLIVVAIIGILVALLVPNAIIAIQKSKQKQTMNDIITIITACTDYITDHGEAPANGAQSGELVAGNAFINALAPTYVRSCPVNDNWNSPFLVYSGTSVADAYDIEEEDVSKGDMLIASQGRHAEDDGWTYDPANPDSGLYRITSQASFENDLINLNGSWIRGPRIGSGT